MKTVGIIAEYNPFHKGHEYHIREAKRIAGADVAVVVMSGSFVQRGEPAIADKYTRTSMALACGADIIIELPMLYATASAELFAFGAVSLLNMLGVEALCFGSECADVEALELVACILSKEPEKYRNMLKEYLADGDSFPKARQRALCEYIKTDKSDILQCFGEMAERLDENGLKAILSEPNNLLGIEYMKAIKKCSPNMKAYTVARCGQGYNDTAENDKEDEPASAAFIRAKIGGGDVNKAFDKIPKTARSIFRESIEAYGAVCADDFSALLNYKIYSIMREDSSLLLNYADVNEPLANKITRIYGKEHFDGEYSELAMLLKSKDMTYTRISRALLHILLDVKLDSWAYTTPYARVLGFGIWGREWLSAMRRECPIPLITRASADLELLRDDIYASSIYNQVVYRKSGIRLPDDYKAVPVLHESK